MNQTTLPKDEGTPASAADIAIGAEAKASSAKSRIIDEAGKIKEKAGVKAVEYADAGKGKASDALDGLSKLLRDAAASVDEKLGANYGQYARKTADAIAGAATSLRKKDLTSIGDDAREFVRKSPVVAIGAAAAFGFVLARLLKSGGSSGQDDA